MTAAGEADSESWWASATCRSGSRLIRLEQVQLDGDLNPGNSGGPIVDVDQSDLDFLQGIWKGATADEPVPAGHGHELAAPARRGPSPGRCSTPPKGGAKEVPSLSVRCNFHRVGASTSTSSWKRQYKRPVRFIATSSL